MRTELAKGVRVEGRLLRSAGPDRAYEGLVRPLPRNRGQPQPKWGKRWPLRGSAELSKDQPQVARTRSRYSTLKDPPFITIVCAAIAIGAGAIVSGSKYPVLSLGFLATWVVAAVIASVILAKKRRHGWVSPQSQARCHDERPPPSPRLRGMPQLRGGCGRLCVWR